MNKNIERGHCIRQSILKYVVGYIEEHGYSPSLQEIGNAVGLRSKCTVHHHLQKMFESGMLETDAVNSTPRAIRVPGYKFVKIQEDGGKDDEKHIIGSE